MSDGFNRPAPLSARGQGIQPQFDDYSTSMHGTPAPQKPGSTANKHASQFAFKRQKKPSELAAEDLPRTPRKQREISEDPRLQGRAFEQDDSPTNKRLAAVD